MEHNPQTPVSLRAKSGQGLTIDRYFTTPGKHPFDTVDWERRDARIGHGERVSFEQAEVEFPKPGPRTQPTSWPRSTSAASPDRPSANGRSSR